MNKLCQINRAKASFDEGTLTTLILALVMSKLYLMLLNRLVYFFVQHQETPIHTELCVQNHECH